MATAAEHVAALTASTTEDGRSGAVPRGDGDGLHVTVDDALVFPVETATETVGILATKRSGKSNAAVAMAEATYDIGVPICVIDPKGDWWGMRLGADGVSPGRPILVLGGEHGDIPLEPSAGRVVAQPVAEKRVSCILDVSRTAGFSKADRRGFLADFADELFLCNREPMHLYCEECDEYIPQVVRNEDAKLVGAFETLVKDGGFRGLGVTLITQRSASLNNNVLMMVQTLIVLRTLGPTDQHAVMDWMKSHQAAPDVAATLPYLTNGEAWVFSPAFMGLLRRVRFLRRGSFDSGETPKVGVVRREPGRLADVDVEWLRSAMAETIEKAEAEDPRALRKRIADLERQLAERPRPEAVVERVEVPVLGGEVRAELHAESVAIAERCEQMAATARDILDALEGRPVWEPEPVVPPRPRPTPRPEQAPERAEEKPAAPPPAKPAAARREPKPFRTTTPPPGDAPGSGMTPAKHSILDALAWWEAIGEEAPTRQQVGFVAQRNVTGGSGYNTVSALRTAGMLDYAAGATGRLCLTDAGRQLARRPATPATDAGLQALVMSKLTPVQQRILGALVERHPESVSREDLGAIVGANLTGGSGYNNVSRLHTMELVTYPERGQLRAANALFLPRRRGRKG